MQIRPLRVRRVGTVVDDRCPLTCPLRVGLNIEVRADDLDPFRNVGASAADRGTHPVTSRRQMAGHCEAQRTSSQDDVQHRCRQPSTG